MGDFSTQMEDTNTADRIKHDLKVPGESTVALAQGDYLIWYASSKIVHQAHSSSSSFDEEDISTTEPVENFYGPDITWTITGPEGIAISISEGASMSLDDECAMVSFNAPAKGNYNISATAAEDADFEGFSYQVCDDIMEAQMNAALESAGDIGTGILKTLAGFAAMGLFGLIGVIMVIVYAVKK